jgi:hypothetical protein
VKAAMLAGAAYFLIVFAAGFVLGTIRVFVLLPRMSELTAVAIELPFMLAIAWAVCGRILRAFDVARDVGTRLLMGTVAFLLLIAAELALGMIGFGRTIADQMAAWTAPAGALGLAGQIAFAFFPLMKRRRT